MSPRFDIREPLWRYRVMAWIVGVMLILVFATIPFPKIDAVLGPIHGILYIVYLATVLNMLITYRIGLWYFIGMVTAGWCPFVSFICERLITRRLAAPWAEAGAGSAHLEPAPTNPAPSPAPADEGGL